MKSYEELLQAKKNIKTFETWCCFTLDITSLLLISMAILQLRVRRIYHNFILSTIVRVQIALLWGQVFFYSLFDCLVIKNGTKINDSRKF